MFRKMSVYFKGNTIKMLLGPALKLAEAVFELLVPLVVASIIDNGIKTGDTSHIWRMGLVLVALGAIGLAFSITAQYFAAVSSVGFACRMRERVFARVMGMTQSQTASVGESTLIARLTSDIDSVQNGLNLALRLMLRSPFVVFGAMIMAFTVDVHSAWAFAVAIPVLGVCVFGIMALSAPLVTRARESVDSATSLARENITGARVIRAFGRESDENARFGAVSRELNARRSKAGRVTALTNPLTSVIVNAALIALIYTGALRVEIGGITQGELVALVNYMSQILIELIKLANLTMSVSRAVSCFKRAQAIADMPEGMDIQTQIEALDDNVAVRFDNVSFTYENAGAPALSGISFSVKAGQTVGIVGPTGAGKSSLINLIPRFYDATDGGVYVFGKDVKSVSVEALRKKIAIVPQKAVLFRGTISDNIRFGRADASDDTIMQALTDAQGADIVKSRGSLESDVGAFGRALSGGQRQRVSIARALIKPADILILDDSSSALDFATDARLRAAIASKRGMTVFIVSQRASGVKNADIILVMDEGKIVASGTHAELMSGCELYAEIYRSQFPEGDEYAK